MTGKAIRHAWRPLLPLAVLAVVLALHAPSVHAVVASGGTATASPTPGQDATTPPVAITASPTPTTGHPSASATPTSSAVASGSSSSPDILKYALLTIGAAGAAAVILLLGYLVRRRVGYDPHREKPGDGGDHH